MYLGKNSNSFPRPDTIIIYICQGDRGASEGGGWTRWGETGWALLCHSLGSEKGWNKEVFKIERWEERQAIKEGQGLSSPRSHSIIERTGQLLEFSGWNRQLRTLYLEGGESQGFSFNLLWKSSIFRCKSPPTYFPFREFRTVWRQEGVVTDLNPQPRLSFSPFIPTGAAQENYRNIES